MSLTITLQKILAQIESLNIPEGDYLTLSNDLKIVYDGVTILEDAKTEPTPYDEQYNYSWEHETERAYPLQQRITEYSWGADRGDRLTERETIQLESNASLGAWGSSLYRTRAEAFEENDVIPYGVPVLDDLTELIDDQDLIEDERRILEWQQNYINGGIISTEI